MTTDHKTAREQVKRGSKTRWPGARNSGPSWASPAVTNSWIAVVAGGAVIGNAGRSVIAVAAVEVSVGGDRCSGRGGNGSGRTRDAERARFGGRGDGSRKRRRSDQHQGNLL